MIWPLKCSNTRLFASIYRICNLANIHAKPCIFFLQILFEQEV